MLYLNVWKDANAQVHWSLLSEYNQLEKFKALPNHFSFISIIHIKEWSEKDLLYFKYYSNTSFVVIHFSSLFSKVQLVLLFVEDCWILKMSSATSSRIQSRWKSGTGWLLPLHGKWGWWKRNLRKNQNFGALCMLFKLEYLWKGKWSCQYLQVKFERQEIYLLYQSYASLTEENYSDKCTRMNIFMTMMN